MKPAAFEYHRPTSLAEVLALLARLGLQAKVVAGGQSLVPVLNMRLAQPAHLIDLNDLTEWEKVVDHGDVLELGFLTRHRQLAESALVRQHCPLVAQVAQTIGHFPIRQRGTLGGSLCNADPVAQLCLMAITLDAHMLLARDGSRRSVRARDFFKAAMSTDLQPDELLVGLRVPKLQPQEASAYRMFNRRHGDYAIVASAVTVRLAAGQVEALRLGISGTSPVPLRLSSVEDAYRGQAPTAPWVDAVAKAVAAAVEPEDDPQIPAAYRRQLAQEMTARALTRCLQRLGVPKP
jgi:carbon-monoxide dehydrogenase medium subunit